LAFFEQQNPIVSSPGRRARLNFRKILHLLKELTIMPRKLKDWSSALFWTSVNQVDD
jgi:hypothetical protein